MKEKPLNPLPDIATLKAAYSQKSSVKAVAKCLHIAQHRAALALFDAGIIDSPGWQPPASEKEYVPRIESLCADCCHATAPDCEYLAAERDNVADVLDRLNLQYIAKENTYRDSTGKMKEITVYTVTFCPRYMAGELELWDGVSPAVGGEQAELRFPHIAGRL